LTLLGWVFAINDACGQFDFEAEPIRYSAARASDRVAGLQAAIESGRVKLEHDSKFGYLKGLLAALDISQDSQLLVFSQTSFQLRKISPQQPRALYFNDDTHVGWVQQGDVLEIATQDPRLGTVFYTLDVAQREAPRFIRDQGNCLTCHLSPRTEDIPGLLVRSVVPTKSGVPMYGAGSFQTLQSSPFEQRWGGWYVSGTHGAMRHMGNVVCAARDDATLDREAGANQTALGKWVDLGPYLTPHSDLVALMVHEHQVQMLNLINLANYEYTLATHYDRLMNEALQREPDHQSDSARRRIESACDKLVQHLLFRDEFRLTAPIRGTSGFEISFEKRGPFDRAGRSLRQFDLSTRMFKYPCSYLIYSPQFDQLPEAVRLLIYEKLDLALGEDHETIEPDHGRLAPKAAQPMAYSSQADREAIREILAATKPEFSDWLSRRRGNPKP
jgi:hypothetical protein